METRAELQGFRELLQKEKQLAQIKTKVSIDVHFPPYLVTSTL